MVYKATRNGMGHLTVHRVPIFVECKRGEMDFDAAWIAAAVQKAKKAELEGYFPPLHIRHHGEGETVKSAGFFKITGAGPITFKGSTRMAIYAELVITAPWVEEDVLKARLPYRSVEIFDVDEPAINSLALLDHEPPYLELPMLMVADIEGEPNRGRAPESVANATFANPWQAEGYKTGEPVVACFRRGHSAHLFFQDQDTEQMAVKNTPNAVRFAEDDKEKTKQDGDDAVKMEEGEGGLDVGSVVKAITDGSISVADMEEIKAAIITQQGAVGAEEEEEAPEAVAAPAPTPGEAMKNGPDALKFAALNGKIAALEAASASRSNAEARKDLVEESMLRLEGRPLGANFKGELVDYCTQHGNAAGKAFVDSVIKTLGTLPDSSHKAAAFSGQTPQNTPKAALVYTEQGTDAVEKAMHFSVEHKELAERGLVRTSEEHYVASNMARAGFTKPAK
jgi:hypothetical protein